MHLAEIATTLASGTAHWRFGNVDWKVVSRLAVPGGIGAFVGAVALSSLSAEAAEPIVAGILLALGVYILVRFARGRAPVQPTPGGIKAVFLAPLGLFAGAMDAMGGGGWGPIGTPTLIASGRMEPRKVIGSVDASEFLVAIGASAGFLVALGSEKIDYAWVGALLVGGLVAAPIAAWLVRSLPAHVLGLSVGTLIVITNVAHDRRHGRRRTRTSSPACSSRSGSPGWRSSPRCCGAPAPRRRSQAAKPSSASGTVRLGGRRLVVAAPAAWAAIGRL